MRAEAPRWWLGEEAGCPFCLQGHAVEVTRWCVSCDRPVCPICAVEVRVREVVVVCPECTEEEEDG